MPCSIDWLTSKQLSSSRVAEEYMKLAGLTIKGLRKLGYTGGPIMGEKEAAGIR